MTKFLIVFFIIFLANKEAFADLAANKYFVNIDIHYSQMPKPSEYASAPIRNVTIGDLHGNTLTLLHTFVILGILKIDEAHAEETTAMYNNMKEIVIKNSKPHNLNPLTDEEFKSFQRFLNGFEVIDRGIHIRLLGDILSERISNDILNLEFMKKIFSKLSPEKLEIIYSNHDNSFFIFNFSAKKNMPVEFIHSAVNAQKFLKKNPTYKKHFAQSIQEYIDHLYMFSIDEQLGRIYSHGVLSQKILDACFLRSQDNSIDIKSVNNSYKVEKINAYFKKIFKNMVSIPNLTYISDLTPSGRVFVEFGLSPAVKVFLNDFYWESYPSVFVQRPFYWALWSDTNIKNTMNYVNKFNINHNKLFQYIKNGQMLKPHYDYLPTNLAGNLLFTTDIALGDIQNNIHAHTFNFRSDGKDATLDNSVGKKLVCTHGKYYFPDATLTIEVVPLEKKN